MTDQVKILFLSANPRALGRIRLDEEVREVDEKILMSELRDQLALIPHFAVRPGDLRQSLLRHKPHILHFSGHGSSDEGIILEDNSGRNKPVSSDALAALFRVIKDNLRVVVLNACYSSLQAKGISQIVDFTIGMKKAIGDRSAIVFSAAFYQGLAYGRSVQESFDLGVNAIMLEGIAESDIPVLLKKKGADAAQTYLVSHKADKNKPAGQAASNPPQNGPRGSLIFKDSEISGRDMNFTGQSNITNYNAKKK